MTGPLPGLPAKLLAYRSLLLFSLKVAHAPLQIPESFRHESVHTRLSQLIRLLRADNYYL